MDSQQLLYEKTDKARQVELDRLKEEVDNLTESLASGVDPTTVKNAINERVTYIDRLNAMAEVQLPEKIAAKELAAQAAEVRRIAEGQDPDRKRTIARRYIAKIEAIAEERTVILTARSLPTICRHSLVAPKGFEPSISAVRGRCPGPLDDGATIFNLTLLV